MRIRVCPPIVFEGLDVDKTGIQLLGTGNFSNYLMPGDGVVIYQPNTDYSECQILAICEVVSAYPDLRRTSLDVRQVCGAIHPDSHARWRWSKNPYLCLDVSKIKKYEILRFFAEVFSEEEWREDFLEDCVQEVFRPNLSLPTLLPSEGLIYLMKGSALYKIGKTINLDNRKRTIERDVQESLEVVHTISSNDITRAELSLHEKYRLVRKWGEWFDLTPAFVAEICAIDRLEM
jgi:Meiotically up-regulated gene 113